MLWIQSSVLIDHFPTPATAFVGRSEELTEMTRMMNERTPEGRTTLGAGPLIELR